MVRPEISGDTLHLHVEGLDKLWAFKSELAIPLQHTQMCGRTRN